MKSLLFILCSWLISVTAAAAPKLPIAHIPQTLAKDCRGGTAKIYDECGDQKQILQAAQAQAKSSGKTVLVVFGAEWCIWCHVFDQYIKGGSGFFNYEWKVDGAIERWPMAEQENKRAHIEAAVLNRFVAKNFVVAHIEGGVSPNGYEVVESTGLDMALMTAIPFIFVVDENNQYVAHMDNYNEIEGLEIRMDSGEEFRGFNRIILVKELLKLSQARTAEEQKSRHQGISDRP